MEDDARWYSVSFRVRAQTDLMRSNNYDHIDTIKHDKDTRSCIASRGGQLPGLYRLLAW